jgi:hypothetical protein
MLFTYLFVGAGCLTEALFLITTVPIFVMSMTYLLLGIAGVLGALFLITTVFQYRVTGGMGHRWTVEVVSSSFLAFHP